MNKYAVLRTDLFHNETKMSYWFDVVEEADIPEPDKQGNRIVECGYLDTDPPIRRTERTKIIEARLTHAEAADMAERLEARHLAHMLS